MPSRMIAVWAALIIGVLTLVDVAVQQTVGATARFWYTGSVRIALFLLVALCAALSAHRFGWWEERLGRAWTLFFLAYSLLCATEVTKRLFRDRQLTAEILLALANLALIGAYWLFARSFRAAGLRYYGSRARMIGFFVLVVVLAVALVEGSIASAAATLGTANPHPGQLFSALADLITFLLAAPLLLMAFSLRGGHLFWIFGLLTAGTFGWMVNQASGRLLPLIGWQAGVATGRNFGFAMACCFIAAAALVQWVEVYRGTKGDAVNV